MVAATHLGSDESKKHSRGLVTVLSGFYRDGDEARSLEFRECILRNLENPLVDGCHVFIEDSTSASEILGSMGEAEASKLHLIAHGRRMTFADLFEYANRVLAGRIVAIANADIFFDTTIGLTGGLDLSGKMLCLSRWDEQAEGVPVLFDHHGSQDAWIFRAPITRFAADFHLGLPGCDNRLAYEVDRAGIAVSNPARSIRARHLHLTAVRRYTHDARVAGPTLSVPATTARTTSAPIAALTSLPSNRALAGHVGACLATWREAGLRVIAFNHPSEIPQLRQLYGDVEFQAVEETSHKVFGRHYVPIARMVAWARNAEAPSLIVNADIEIRLDRTELARLGYAIRDGICFFVRHNHNGDRDRSVREPYGIDGFLLDGRTAPPLADSFLSMGQPYWDYWLPYVYLQHDRLLLSVEYPALFHREHATRWDWNAWRRCAVEFARASDLPWGDASPESLGRHAVKVRQSIDKSRTIVDQAPPPIREWVTRRFDGAGEKLFIELGAHDGSDTAWLSSLPGVTMHTFEPDPRNHPAEHPNVTVHRMAVSDRDGPGTLILSESGWGQEWTYSSSIKTPKHHLDRFPVTFGGSVQIEEITLDSFTRREGIDVVDFIWADIQGAEGEMIRGGLGTLAKTRYLFTEYSNDELYEDQVSLPDILRVLPDFRVVELWPDDVLLENTRLSGDLRPS